MCTIKTGCNSIILGPGYFNNYFPNKENKLLKISKISDNHNELKYLDKIRQIENYKSYYSIPEDISYIINPSDNFYNYIKQLVGIESQSIFNTSLYAFYIDNAGDRDLHDTFLDLGNKKDMSVWKSYNSILKFSLQIMEGLSHLHKYKLCHLDIKPENIVVNTSKFKFKIIDFGFTSKEPFDDYVEKIKGTPGYFPANIKEYDATDWLPEIYANDLISIDGITPIKKNRKLIYKIDSYCFGRVLYYLRYVFEDNLSNICCSQFFKNNKNKVDNIIYDLLNNNVYTRITITNCKNKYF